MTGYCSLGSNSLVKLFKFCVILRFSVETSDLDGIAGSFCFGEPNDIYYQLIGSLGSEIGIFRLQK